jgi:hypothetical protein
MGPSVSSAVALVLMVVSPLGLAWPLPLPPLRPAVAALLVAQDHLGGK